MRLPNGVGSVTKVTEKRLYNPWRARREIGRYTDPQGKLHRKYKNIGYFKTRAEAVDALMRYVPEAEAKGAVSLERVYKEWSKTKYPTISKKLSDNYRKAWERFELLKDRDISTLRVLDYEMVIDDSVPPSMRKMCKIVLSQMYQYALRHEYCDKNYAELVDFHYDTAEHRDKVPFTPKEVEVLWNSVGVETVDMVLVGIYTGLRPTELLEIDITKFRDGCIVGGIKTENGKNRLIPIHPKILPIIEDYAIRSAKIGVKWLFPNTLGKKYDLQYWRRRRFDPIFSNHTPHEMRHTFATYAKKSGMDRYLVKRIMGHAIDDLTESVYTHVDAGMLLEEIKKFEIK